MQTLTAAALLAAISLAPVDTARPLVATCHDGFAWHAKTDNATHGHRFACSQHGGVASWADGSVVRIYKRKGGAQ